MRKYYLVTTKSCWKLLLAGAAVRLEILSTRIPNIRDFYPTSFKTNVEPFLVLVERNLVPLHVPLSIFSIFSVLMKRVSIFANFCS
ncbi:hypothetical protein Dbac_1258 [Desulfomicrobium baculatum DSM 4028]|uniref:Uncharacterized protein n=1 Tax=Desulfomicrobium baculatum (strain DSM 4028 / VKM B-1378 / X) TaxID=525897 RepID=C7LRX8_DESBD|nr:hypothetical protein Dbac_1258 [Desulfomicrobium baculatum DSM 4028]